MLKLITIIGVTLLLLRQGHAEKLYVGTIDFFGTDGVNIQEIQKEVAPYLGFDISGEGSDQFRAEIISVVTRAIGHKPSDVVIACCDSRGQPTAYIGLGGTNSRVIASYAKPTGTKCLTKTALRLYNDLASDIEGSIIAGRAAEDHSKGYALSSDEYSRVQELRIRKYAITHELEIARVLNQCTRSEDRRVAAELIGYAGKSEAQLAALLHAIRDPDATVRNNALRALWVLVDSNPAIASRLPGDYLVCLLNSDMWTDRNKAGMLLAVLTQTRDPKMLERLRTETLPSLIEMAHWKVPSHSYPYKILLGRIAGMSDEEVLRLTTRGSVDQLAAAAEALR